MATATAMYSGETIYKDLTEEIENLQSFECNLTAENYNLNGTNFTTNETGYILSLDINFKPDNLTIECLLSGQKWVEDNVGSSGGGSSGGGSSGGGSSCYTKYECSTWSECIDGTSIRSCVGLKERCQGHKPFPETTISCVNENKPTQDIVEEEVINITEEPKAEEEKDGFFKRIWNWIRGLFKRGEQNEN